MDLIISWTLNTIGTIFYKESGSGTLPAQTEPLAAGYILDAEGSWRVACLAPLSGGHRGHRLIWPHGSRASATRIRRFALIYLKIGMAAANRIELHICLS